MDAIVIRDLSKRYRETLAVDSLDLNVKKSECMGLLGPNGAGKTTTIKVLTAMISPTSGSVYLNGVDVTRERKRALVPVGALVETPEFYPYLTPVEVLAYLGRMRGMSAQDVRRRSDEVIDGVGLKEWKDRKVGKFSKGMKQRLALAQVMLHDPEILILDEPASGLDPRGMVEVRTIITDLKRQGRTIFLSSHMLHEVKGTCDRVALIDKGRLLLCGDVASVSQRFSRGRIEVKSLEPLTRELVEKLKTLENVERVEWRYTTHVYIDLRGGPEEVAGLLDGIRGLGIRVTSFAQVSEGLEEMYMHLVESSL